MKRTTGFVFLLATGLWLGACGGGDRLRLDTDDVQVPVTGEEYWYVSITSCRDYVNRSRTSWGTATLGAAGAMEVAVFSNVNCGAEMPGPQPDAGWSCAVDAVDHLVIENSAGESGEGQRTGDGSFLSFGLTSEGSRTTMGCLLRKEDGHTAESMEGEWHVVWLEQCDCLLTSCAGLATFDGGGGWSATFQDCASSSLWVFRPGERDLDGGEYTVGPDGALLLTGIPAMGGVGFGGNIAIAAGDPAGGRNHLLVFLRPTENALDALNPRWPEFQPDLPSYSEEHHAVIFSTMSGLAVDDDGPPLPPQHRVITADLRMCGSYDSVLFPCVGTMNQNGTCMDLDVWGALGVLSADGTGWSLAVGPAEYENSDWLIEEPYMQGLARFSIDGQVGILGCLQAEYTPGICILIRR